MSGIEDLPTASSSAAVTAREPLAVFVGGPFYRHVDRETGLMDASERSKIETVLEHFDDQGFTVFNAHRRESWGSEFLPPEECTRLDFNDVRQADLVVAFPGSPVSPGTHIEIGWASALGKPIVLLLEQGREYAFLITGLGSMANVEFITYENIGQALAELDDAVHRVLVKAQTWA